MPNLTVDEYFEKYGREAAKEQLLKVSLIRSTVYSESFKDRFPGSGDRIVWLKYNTRTDKFVTTVASISYEADRKTIFTIITDSDFGSQKYDPDRAERDATLADPVKQKAIIEKYIEKLYYLNNDAGTWKIIEDNWDPNIIPPEDIKGYVQPPDSPKQDSTDSGVNYEDPSLLTFKLNGISDGFSIEAKRDLPAFHVFFGPYIYKRELEEETQLDDEYSEVANDSLGGPTSNSASAFVDNPSVVDLGGATPSMIDFPSKAAKKIGIAAYGSKYLLDFDGKKGAAYDRLARIPTELTKYLNNNGFKSVTIDMLSVERDLGSSVEASTGQEPGSFHGMGLAIDLKFTSTHRNGFKWSSFADNKSLVLYQNGKLTEVIAKWVADQKDLVWGASWGGSRPSEGKVVGDGILEYHHMEIRKENIPTYLEPYSDFIKDVGFDHTKMDTAGRNSVTFQFMKSMLKVAEQGAAPTEEVKQPDDVKKDAVAEGTKKKFIVVGDSQTPSVDFNNTYFKMIDAKGVPDTSLWQVGIGIDAITKSIDKFPVSADVKGVAVCIGTNGGYGLNATQAKAKGTTLVAALRKVFPSAKLYLIKGSWGWGRYLTKTKQKTVESFYDNFNQGFDGMVKEAIGWNKEHPSNSTPSFKIIGEELDAIAKTIT